MERALFILQTDRRHTHMHHIFNIKEVKYFFCGTVDKMTFKFRISYSILLICGDSNRIMHFI